MSARKEPYFLVQPMSLLGCGPDDLGTQMVGDFEAYAKLFQEAVEPCYRAVGEASAGYLYFHHAVLPNIKRVLGDPKIIIVLRDPIERALSSHLHHVRKGIEPLSFEMALAEEPRRAEQNWWFGFQLRGVSRYFGAVRAYREAFAHVRVCLFDDLQADAEALVADLYSFLGVDPSWSPDTSVKHNVSLVPRSAFLGNLLAGKGRSGKWLGGATRMLRMEGLARRARDVLSSWNQHRPSVRPETRRMLQDDFREDVERLAELVGRDLSGWLR